MTPAEIYRQRKDRFQAIANGHFKRYNRLSLLRAAVLIGSFALVIYLFGVNTIAGAISIMPMIAVMGQLVIWHGKIKAKGNTQQRLSELNEEEAKRAAGYYDPLSEGTEFMNPEHPYTADLDIFGRHSVFAGVNRTRSPHGKQLLARWLKDPAGAGTIKKRQEAAKELSNELDFRQKLLLFAERIDKSFTELEHIARWAADASGFHQKAGIRLLRYGYPAITITAFVLWFAGIIYWFIPIVLFLGSFLVLRQFKERIEDSHRATNGHARSLTRFARIFQLVSQQSFTAAYLRSLQQAIGTDAYRETDQLQSIAASFDARLNAIIYLLANGLLLWDLYLVSRLEKWRAKAGTNLQTWFQHVGELEALCSFANLRFNEPDFTFAEISDDGFVIEFKEAGHLLIPREQCVTNDLKLTHPGQIQLITGSNMAGKSTYLRTIGTNIVLSLAGAPCYASAAKLSSIRLISSMRNADALDEHISSFYAELLRLKIILDETRKSDNTFFLIDEILKGTNSTDRHKGSVALVKQLLAANGTGLISTHDLELAEKAREMEGIQNFSFEVEIEDGNLDFDYKKHEGICRSLNASILMKQMGIEV